MALVPLAQALGSRRQNLPAGQTATATPQPQRTPLSSFLQARAGTRQQTTAAPGQRQSLTSFMQTRAAQPQAAQPGFGQPRQPRTLPRTTLQTPQGSDLYQTLNRIRQVTAPLGALSTLVPRGQLPGTLGALGAVSGAANIGTALTAPDMEAIRRALAVTQGASQVGGGLNAVAGNVLPQTAARGLGAAGSLAGLGLSAYDLATQGTKAIPGAVLNAPVAAATLAELAGIPLTTATGLIGSGAAATGVGAAGAGAAGAGAAGAGTAASTAAPITASTIGAATLPLAAVFTIAQLSAANAAKKKFHQISGNVDETRQAVEDLTAAFEGRGLQDALAQPVRIGGNPTVGSLLRQIAELNLQGKIAPTAFGGAIDQPRYVDPYREGYYAQPRAEYGPVVEMLNRMGIQSGAPAELSTLMGYGASPVLLSVLDALAAQAKGIPSLAGTGPQPAMTPEQYTEQVVGRLVGSMPQDQVLDAWTGGRDPEGGLRAKYAGLPWLQQAVDQRLAPIRAQRVAQEQAQQQIGQLQSQSAPIPYDTYVTALGGPNSSAAQAFLQRMESQDINPDVAYQVELSESQGGSAS